MTPLFLLQIVKPDGSVVRLPSSGDALERDLIATCTRAIVAKGVGFWKTEAMVAAAIEAGITEVVRDLKFETAPLVNHR